MSSESRLAEKLRAIEALFAGATTDGERDAADRAKQRIRAAIAEAKPIDPPMEYRITLNPWSARLFIALARRYGMEPYRYRGQRRTTLMVKGPQQFLKQTFFPEFEQMNATLQSHLSEVTTKVVAEVLDANVSEPAEVEEPKQLEAFVDGGVREQ